MGRTYEGSTECLSSSDSGLEVRAWSGLLDASSSTVDEGRVLAETGVVGIRAAAKVGGRDAPAQAGEEYEYHGLWNVQLRSNQRTRDVLATDEVESRQWQGQQ